MAVHLLFSTIALLHFSWLDYVMDYNTLVYSEYNIAFHYDEYVTGNASHVLSASIKEDEYQVRKSKIAIDHLITSMCTKGEISDILIKEYLQNRGTGDILDNPFWDILAKESSCVLFDKQKELLYISSDIIGANPLFLVIISSNSFDPSDNINFYQNGILVTTDALLVASLGIDIGLTPVGPGVCIIVDTKRREVKYAHKPKVSNSDSFFDRNSHQYDKDVQLFSKWVPQSMLAVNDSISKENISTSSIISELDATDPSSLLLQCVIPIILQSSYTRYVTPALVQERNEKPPQMPRILYGKLILFYKNRY